MVEHTFAASAHVSQRCVHMFPQRQLVSTRYPYQFIPITKSTSVMQCNLQLRKSYDQDTNVEDDTATAFAGVSVRSSFKRITRMLTGMHAIVPSEQEHVAFNRTNFSATRQIQLPLSAARYSTIETSRPVQLLHCPYVQSCKHGAVKLFRKLSADNPPATPSNPIRNSYSHSRC